MCFGGSDLRNPTSGITPIPITDIVGDNNLNIVGNVGIESTPVIDLSSQTLTISSSHGPKKYQGPQQTTLPHGSDITKGSEKFGGPVVIQGSVPGSGQGSSGGTLVFDSSRPMFEGLALNGGRLLPGGIA